MRFWLSTAIAVTVFCEPPTSVDKSSCGGFDNAIAGADVHAYAVNRPSGGGRGVTTPFVGRRSVCKDFAFRQEVRHEGSVPSLADSWKRAHRGDQFGIWCDGVCHHPRLRRSNTRVL